MACPKIGRVEVSLGLRKRELIRDIGKPHHIGASDFQGANVPTEVVNHGKKFVHVLDGFAFLFVFREQTCGGTLVAVQDEIDEFFPG